MSTLKNITSTKGVIGFRSEQTGAEPDSIGIPSDKKYL
jgi:hypothetical protein